MSDKPLSAYAIEPERYELSAPPSWLFASDRRSFFKFFGAGLFIICAASKAAALQESGASRRNSEDSLPKEIDAWLHIGEKGEITVFTGKVEVGQNIRTSLSQGVAEELRVPLDSIRLVMGDTQLVPFDMGTFGSRTTPTMNLQFRRELSQFVRRLDPVRFRIRCDVSRSIPNDDVDGTRRDADRLAYRNGYRGGPIGPLSRCRIIRKVEWPIPHDLCAKKPRFQFIVDARKHAVRLVSRKCRDDAAVLDMNRIAPNGIVDWRLEKIRWSV
jgi:Molybdopterin cofactor-binding domain